MTDIIQLEDVTTNDVARAFDPYSGALESVLRDVPYNSAMAYHHAHGTARPDDRLGSACIIQSIEAATRAHASGAPTPILLHDDRHVAAVFDDPEVGIVVLDPYLLHRRPVIFPRHEVDRGASTVEVAAAPVRTSAGGFIHAGKLRARYVGTDHGFVIRLSTTKFSPSLGRYSIARHFTLRSSALFSRARFTDNLHDLLTHPEQTSVSVRTLDLTDGTTAEAILPLHGYARREFYPHDIWLRDGQGAMSSFGSSDADGVWAALERMLCMDRKEVVDHLVGAARIYQAIADPDKDLAPYSTASE